MYAVPAIKIAGTRITGGAPKKNTAIPTRADVTDPTISELDGISTNLFTASIP